MHSEGKQKWLQIFFGTGKIVEKLKSLKKTNYENDRLLSGNKIPRNKTKVSIRFYVTLGGSRLKCPFYVIKPKVSIDDNVLNKNMAAIKCIDEMN
jgi:hypothetical protein